MMMAPQLGRTRALGAVDLYASQNNTNADLSVKAYAKNGGMVWASYQSPRSNEILKALQGQLRRLGANLSTDGVIDAADVSAAQSIARRYFGNQFPLNTGGTTDDTARKLYAVASSPEQLAKRGYFALYYAKQIADTYVNDQGGTQPPATPVPAPTTPIRPPTPTLPVTNLPPSSTVTPTYPPQGDPLYTNASSPLFQKKHWAWYVAGGVLLIGLGTATYLVWKPE